MEKTISAQQEAIWEASIYGYKKYRKAIVMAEKHDGVDSAQIFDLFELGDYELMWEQYLSLDQKTREVIYKIVSGR